MLGALIKEIMEDNQHYELP
jgi:hypothetical protein